MLAHLGFDLETAKVIEDFSIEELNADDLGVTCAATYQLNEVGGTIYEGSVRWHGAFGAGLYAPRMAPRDADRLIRYLIWRHYSDHLKVVTWNGASFDFRVLHDSVSNSAMRHLCKAMALDHVDPGYQMLCEKGYMCSLDGAAHGLGLEGKTAGVSGADAPKMWQATLADQEKVLEYVIQDAKVTAQVSLALSAHTFAGLRWITKAGTKAVYPWWPSFWLYDTGQIISPDVANRGALPRNQDYLFMLEQHKPHRLLTVAESMTLPLPDTSWMKDAPPVRESYTDWI